MKVEQLASGSIYCQFFNLLFPGSVGLSKVNWAAKHEHEFISNFKLLQAAMNLMSIQKHVPVEKLVKAKLTDNLEFAQWFKTNLWDRYCKSSEKTCPVPSISRLF